MLYMLLDEGLLADYKKIFLAGQTVRFPFDAREHYVLRNMMEWGLIAGMIDYQRYNHDPFRAFCISEVFAPEARGIYFDHRPDGTHYLVIPLEDE